ncbi:MAG: AAA family ATPase [bacterium]|nr:AAA family ATPase [bacterium]
MPLIEGIRIRNYKVLKDITLGKLWSTQKNKALTPLVAVIGKNGSGKSTLFDAFGFLADCLSVGVEKACDLEMRGGFDRLVSGAGNESISFEVYYRESKTARPITYELTITKDKSGRPYILSERLRQRRVKQKRGWPLSFLQLENGSGHAWIGEEGLEDDKDDLNKTSIQLTDSRQLGIATIGALKEHPRITKFRDFIRNWYLSYFAPDAARVLGMAGPQKQLDQRGANLGNVVQYMEREHPERFGRILERIAKKIPGIQKISAKKSADGRLLLEFNDRGFQDPFYVQQMSDGTIKMFTYLLLLEDPVPPPFICIEEPENGLYHKLLEALAQEFRERTKGPKPSTQIFVTTHQPYFVDALAPEETWILEKGVDGFSTVRNAGDDEVVLQMVKEDIPLGSLWYSDYIDKR